MRALVPAGAGLVLALACGQPEPRDALPVGIVDATTSYFEPALLADDDAWACTGVLDLDRDGGDEIVLIAPGRIRVLAGDGTPIGDTPITPALDGPPLGCDADDVDGDGDLDVVLADGRGGVVARYAAPAFQLSPLPALDDPDGVALAFALALTDVDDDGALDAYVARSISGSSSSFVVHGCRDLPDGDFLCGAPDRTYPGVPNVVLRGDGAGAFAVLPDTGAEDPWQSQAIGVVDVDGDGRQDLVVANDAMENRVYLARGPARFEDATADLGLDVRNHGMSVLAGDLDGDGLTDLAFSDIGAPLVMRRAGAGFERLGIAAGFVPAASWSWGASMEDLDGDGDLDLLFENKGSEIDTVSLYCFEGCTYADLPREELLLYRNDGRARFSMERPVPTAGSPFATGRSFVGGTALTTGDVDRDGVLDVVVARSDAQGSGPSQAWLLRGRSTVGLGVSVEAPRGASVRACVGATCRSREVLGGHGFGAVVARRVFVGIGTATEARVSVSYRGETHDLGIVRAGELARFGG